MLSQASPSVKIVPGNAHGKLAMEVASELGAPIAAVETSAFADGEIRVRITEDVRGTHAVILQPTCPPVNDNLMVLALLADAARAAGAARVTAVVPYFGYARQDRRDHVGEPRSAQVAGRLLAAVGIEHLITIDLHSPALESALPMPATLLGAEEVFLPRIREWGLRDFVVVSPDAGGLKRAQRYAAALAAPLAVIAKARPRADATTIVQVLGNVKGRTFLVVDDMASTGRTLTGAAEALRREGAVEVHAVFTHAVMGSDAAKTLLAAKFGHLMTSNTTPAQSTIGMETITVAPLLARAVRELCG
ncbi:MAG TPA: ribose-phosphate diphosphokinase [Gemmata sp.]|nr:ribose-phosphate diphosphokinase [Gemmata sp.]